MTKSTITRERLQEIAEDGFLKHGESKELARMVLAAMDSEPVAEVEAEFKVRSDDRMMYPPTYCHKHPETVLQVHPFEQLMSHPPQPKMYCPECEPGVAERAERDKQFLQFGEVKP
ncbi:TPA: hypothetical protein ACQ7DO_002904 [Klebsiella pneumoniae]|uniref:hypothetical protein n=1 Tax=Klebsiella pneumoniae complex TaxID=3390273 RepID=UPI0007CC4713|nr:hypothetical protein [Klebsiella pneumoniae]MDE9325654.1 hypothetical protein [Klebsiella pneumoniae]SBH88156.1 Uncharacterised protein [Klebsiella pneumoniae]VFZ46794.1 Uncharacterised protein [Klebsiella pneumoniae]VGB76265.1 Uncharacterised protein [Klebsiella pneumoniae]